MTRGLDVVAAGPLSTVQDLGRHGFAEIGVGASGAADRGALRLANRLLGNSEEAAAVEVTLGGLVVRSAGELTLAITGAPCPITIDGRGGAMNSVLHIPAGAVLGLGTPEAGLRSYVAVRGGIDIDPVLGSRSTDTLAGLGPEPLSSGTVLPVGLPTGPFPVVDSAPIPAPADGEIRLTAVPGPRHDWFTDHALTTLFDTTYEVTADCDRVGIRLRGPVLRRRANTELPSEGMVSGALQVPPSGQPTLFLADHPCTGGYPVIAVVPSSDVDLAAQARPGQRIRFCRADPARVGTSRQRRYPT